jgi:hypothetical protein
LAIDKLFEMRLIFAPKAITKETTTPYVGARNSPRNQLAVSRDFIGSTNATARSCTRSQAGHSNIWMSKSEEGPGLIRASNIIALHFGHGDL